MILLILLVSQCYCNTKECSVFPDQLFKKLHQYVLWNQWAAGRFARVGYLSKRRKVYLSLASLGWNRGVPPVADSVLCSPSLTKQTGSGCPIKFNTFLLQAPDNIKEGDLKTASSKPRITYCQGSVMPRAKDWNKPTQKYLGPCKHPHISSA